MVGHEDLSYVEEHIHIVHAGGSDRVMPADDGTTTVDIDQHRTYGGATLSSTMSGVDAVHPVDLLFAASI